MANNKNGGTKLVETMIEKYGSYEAYKQAMRERASKGGKNGNKRTNPNYSGGFAGDNELAKRAGSLGGSRSMRGHKLVKIEGDTLIYKRLKDNEYIEVKERYV